MGAGPDPGWGEGGFPGGGPDAGWGRTRGQVQGPPP